MNEFLLFHQPILSYVVITVGGMDVAIAQG